MKEVADSLGVSSKNLYSSWEVMNNNGNLSGASNLSVLNHHNELRQRSQGVSPLSSGWAVGLSMGPGICLECVLIRDIRPGRITIEPSRLLPHKPLDESIAVRRKEVHIGQSLDVFVHAT